MSDFPTQEQLAMIEQVRKAAEKRFARYVAKLNEIEKNEEGSPKKKKSYYERKDWLISRAATLLGLYRGKRIGPEPQLLIYPHEAARILKKTKRTAQMVLKMLREKHNKAPRMPVTMREFCDHFSLNIEEVIKALTE